MIEFVVSFRVGLGLHGNAMAEKMVVKGSPYPWTLLDSKGKPFGGSKTYKLQHLPPNILAKDFWSAIVYDTQTRSMLQTDQ